MNFFHLFALSLTCFYQVQAHSAALLPTFTLLSQESPLRFLISLRDQAEAGQNLMEEPTNYFLHILSPRERMNFFPALGITLPLFYSGEVFLLKEPCHPASAHMHTCACTNVHAYTYVHICTCTSTHNHTGSHTCILRGRGAQGLSTQVPLLPIQSPEGMRVTSHRKQKEKSDRVRIWP